MSEKVNLSQREAEDSVELALMVVSVLKNMLFRQSPSLIVMELRQALSFYNENGYKDIDCEEYLKSLLTYNNKLMENQFDRRAVERLHAEGNATVEAIEAITGPLILNQELKGLDEAGNLVTIIKTHTQDGQEQVQYVRRTAKGDGKEPVSFNIDIETSPSSENVE